MKNNSLLLYFIFAAMLLGTVRSNAQSDQTGQPDTLYPVVEKIQSDLAVFGRLKLTGYVQAQFQKADTAGIESFAAGNFPATSDNRFSVRRGRFKLAYDYAFSQYVVQVDVTEKGVGIKDAYLSLTDPWLRAFSLTAGVFDRPFGFEISYSSSSRETPERSRMMQTLFPGERDLGARLTFQPPKTSRFNFLRLDAGLFNGTGPTAVDFDRYKDFIGRVSINQATRNEKVKLGFGLSYYNGGWRQGTRYVYSMGELNTGNDQVPVFLVDSTGSAMGDRLRRTYYGTDLQLTLDLPFGLTQLRGEFITGTQPSTAIGSASPTSQPSDAFIRNFMGGYVYWVQNILQSKFQTVVKYDYYDPNTAVAANLIGSKATGKDKPTGPADIAYSTLGFGIVYKWNSQVRITAYYDLVTNETTSLIAYPTTLKDLSHDRKDNVFTLRIQYKF